MSRSGLQAIKWTAIDNFLLNGFSLLVFFILAYKLDVSNFGLVNICSFIVLFTSMIATFGFRVTIIQRKDLGKIELDSILCFISGLGLMISILIFLLRNHIASFFNQPELSDILKYMWVIVLLKGLTVVPEAIFQRDLNFKILAVRNIFASLISGVLAVFFAFRGFGYFSLVIQQIIAPFISAIFLWVSVKYRPALRLSWNDLKVLLPFSKRILFTELVTIYNKESLRIFISYFLGPIALGYYSLASRLSNITIQVLTVTLTKVALPYFSRIQDDLEAIKNNFYKLTSFAAIIIYPSLVLLLLLIDDLLSITLSSKWTLSGEYFKFLIAGAFILCISYFNGSVITALGKADWRMKIGFVRAIIGSILFFIGSQYSIHFLLSLYLVRILIVEPFQFKMVSMLINISWKRYFFNIGVPFLVSTLVGASTYLSIQYAVEYPLRKVSVVLLLFGIVMGFLICYWAILRRFSSDLKSLEDMIVNRINK